MTLLEEVHAARKKIVTDGYDMSFGELINLYRNDELKINPVFQRLFRWRDERKTGLSSQFCLVSHLRPFSSTKTAMEFGSLSTVCSVCPQCFSSQVS